MGIVMHVAWLNMPLKIFITYKIMKVGKSCQETPWPHS